MYAWMYMNQGKAMISLPDVADKLEDLTIPEIQDLYKERVKQGKPNKKKDYRNQ